MDEALQAKADAVARAIEADVGRCCGDMLNLTGEALAGILVQFADTHADAAVAASVGAERDVLAARCDDLARLFDPTRGGCAGRHAMARVIAEEIRARPTPGGGPGREETR